MPYEQSEDILKLLVELHQQKILALVLYLIGGDRDKARDVTASVFAETLLCASPLETRDLLLVRLARSAVKKAAAVKAASPCDDTDLLDLPPMKRASLTIVRTALLSLPFDLKAIILLRDQLHLPYKNIASILGTGEKNAKIRIVQARLRLRKEIENALSRGSIA